MFVLGIETSCDETAAAVVTGDRRIAANRVLSQIAEHTPFGGIVPEIAARSHLDHLDELIVAALGDAGIGFKDLAGVAATGGPGLIGGVIVGVTMGKAIALAHGLPFVAVNHLEAHALTARLTDDVAFPYLLLLVTGGHTQLLVVEDVGRFRRLGTTLDDAVGEAFDKAAKLLGLPYPGGPAIEALAAKGDARRSPIALPRPMIGRPGCDFSFSGLKTALAQSLRDLAYEPTLEQRADIAAALQQAVAASVSDRTSRAIDLFLERHSPARPTLVVAGGVAANKALRAELERVVARRGFRLVAPPVALCTDNAAMVAWAGVERLRRGLTDELSFAPRPRWPLDAAAPRAVGAGVKA
ncbi:MAG TPA: tRNA (adenosine(37)-N6)-threonylcarbamoyltransferase complex transferase subunit TsaD [Alphaproteobacteria bacterium]|nr:tRNA (adenosine(37)-N6)-threonylcarbamoyltransferase complex transferase subunit TsaD [Alphaproteobacteria bacterium]